MPLKGTHLEAWTRQNISIGRKQPALLRCQQMIRPVVPYHMALQLFMSQLQKVSACVIWLETAREHGLFWQVSA
jgi:hypothetical protein